MTEIPLNLCILESMPIFSQLEREEAILRTSKSNWCLVNRGSSDAIVMGISGNPDALIDKDRYKNLIHPLPIIKRFSGGGTVLIEKTTLFITLIFEKASFQPGESPQDIFKWSEQLYSPVFGPDHFSLQQQDYAFKEKKIGGNAQYFTKTKWLHHTSFLWDFTDEKMHLLKMPEKIPEWRNNRSHDAFLDKLHHYFPSIDTIIDRFTQELNTFFLVKERSETDLNTYLQRPHRKSLTEVHWPKNEDVLFSA